MVLCAQLPYSAAPQFVVALVALLSFLRKMAHLDLRLVPAPWMGVHIQESTCVVGRSHDAYLYLHVLCSSLKPIDARVFSHRLRCNSQLWCEFVVVHRKGPSVQL